MERDLGKLIEQRYYHSRARSDQPLRADIYEKDTLIYRYDGYIWSEVYEIINFSTFLPAMSAEEFYEFKYKVKKDTSNGPKENDIWQIKYNGLKESILIIAEKLEFKLSSQERWCEKTDEVYISYDLDVSQIEETAKKKFKKYDVYKFSHSVGEE